MNLDSKFYRALETISNFFILNFLWLVMCLPIITIFPATTALFGVVRQWKNNSDSGIFKPFFLLFKENLKQSLLIELLCTLSVALVLFDFLFATRLGSPFNLVLIPIFLLLALLLMCTIVFIFPIIVHYQAGFKDTIKNSFLFSISHLSLTVSSLFVVAVIAVLVWIFPISALIVFSLGAYINYSFCNRAFQRYEQLNGSLKSKRAS